MKNEDMRHYPAMEIAISGLGDGEFPFSFDVPAEKIGLSESFVDSVKVDGTLRKVSTQFFLMSHVRTSYAKECDRCLVESQKHIDIPLNIYYQFGHKQTEEEREGDFEVVTLDPDQESIVLDEEVRQTILLDLPLKFLCSEGCLGICPGCGVDLNKERCRCEQQEIDPRWSKLAELFKKDDPEE